MFGIILGLILTVVLSFRIKGEANASGRKAQPYIITTVLLDLVMTILALLGHFWVILPMIAALFIPYVVITSLPYKPKQTEVDFSSHLID